MEGEATKRERKIIALDVATGLEMARVSNFATRNRRPRRRDSFETAARRFSPRVPPLSFCNPTQFSRERDMKTRRSPPPFPRLWYVPRSKLLSRLSADHATRAVLVYCVLLSRSRCGRWKYNFSWNLVEKQRVILVQLVLSH